LTVLKRGETWEKGLTVLKRVEKWEKGRRSEISVKGSWMINLLPRKLPRVRVFQSIFSFLPLIAFPFWLSVLMGWVRENRDWFFFSLDYNNISYSPFSSLRERNKILSFCVRKGGSLGDVP
jgi:hypothetical protein